MQEYNTHIIDKDMAINAICTEIKNLQKLTFLLDEADKLAIQDCQISLNALMLDKLSNPKFVNGIPL